MDKRTDRSRQFWIVTVFYSYGLTQFLETISIQSLYIHTFTGVIVCNIIINCIDLLDYCLIIPHYSLHLDGVLVNFLSHFEYM